MSSRLTTLLKTGAKPGSTAGQRRHLMLSNFVGIVGPLLNLGLIGASFLEGAHARAIVLIVFGSLYALQLPLAAAGLDRVGRHLIAFSAGATVMCLHAIDPTSPFWAMTGVTGIVSVMFFSAEEPVDVTVHVALHFIYALVIFFVPLDGLSALLDQPPMPPWIWASIMLFCLPLAPAMMAELNRQVAHHEAEQLATNDALVAEVQRREALTATLEEQAVALAEQTRLARAASEAKSSFLANMSHEIRTPLAAIISLTELAGESDDPAERARYQGLTARAARHLLQVVNDVLDLSKIEAGKLELDPVPTDVQLLVDDVVELVRSRPDAGHLQIVRTGDVGHGMREVDPLRLRQVLLNLMSNAVKFTEHGSVRLHVEADGDHIRFAVSDTGIGMTPEALARIFQPFEQADRSTSRKHGGTGLGLTISSHILELSGSRLQAVSAPGEGSTFSFDLELPDLGTAADISVTVEPSLDGGALRILVAEDNPVNQLIIRKILEDLGHDVEVVGDGLQAVERAGSDHDVVLMDMRMPELDGVGATRLIRAREVAEGLPRLPIVALTANALADQRAECMDAGMDDWLTKPVDRKRLAQVLGAVSASLPRLSPPATGSERTSA